MPRKSQCDLRPATLDDAERLRGWRNQDRVRANMYGDHLIGAEEHHAWMTRTLASDAAQLLIFELDGRPIGLASFSSINRQAGDCDWGYYLGEAAPQGAGTAMGILTLDHAFGSLGVAQVKCEVFDFNTASLAFLERLGFRREAQPIGQRRKGEALHEVFALSLSAQDWSMRRDVVVGIVFR